jgi:hypothetical protein
MGSENSEKFGYLEKLLRENNILTVLPKSKNVWVNLSVKNSLYIPSYNCEILEDESDDCIANLTFPSKKDFYTNESSYVVDNIGPNIGLIHLVEDPEYDIPTDAYVHLFSDFLKDKSVYSDIDTSIFSNSKCVLTLEVDLNNPPRYEKGRREFYIKHATIDIKLTPHIHVRPHIRK